MRLRKIYGFIIISILLLGANVEAQENPIPDSLISQDTARSKFLPKGVRIGFDLISFGQALARNGVKGFTDGDYGELQFSADIDFYRYFFNVEYGLFNRQWTSADAVYNNTGSHFKIGPDINFLHRDPDGSALFFGLRYSFSNFSDDITYTYTDDYYGPGDGYLENNNLKANWFEFTTGLKVKLTRVIWLGYTARFKFAVSSFEDRALIPHWIPGYGLGADTSSWGFDYWLIVKIPFTKGE